MRSAKRLPEAGIAPSVGSLGDSSDTATAESGIGLFKAEAQRTVARLDAVEFATLAWVDWLNGGREDGRCLSSAADEKSFESRHDVARCARVSSPFHRGPGSQ